MSSKFLTRIFCAFLDLTVPISSIANPACINMTKNADSMIQIVSVSPFKIAMFASTLVSVFEFNIIDGVRRKKRKYYFIIFK